MARESVDLTYKSIRQGVEAGDQHSMLVLRRLINEASIKYMNNTLVRVLIPAAISDNQQKVITFITDIKYSLGDDILRIAIEQDNAAIIEQLIQKDALPQLVEGDQNERMNFLLKILYQTCEQGALKGFLLLEAKLFQEYRVKTSDYYKKFLAEAAKGGRLEIPNLIKERNQVNNNDPENNFSSMLALKKNERYTINLLIVACSNGRLEFVKYLRENTTSDVYDALIEDKSYSCYMALGLFDHMRVKGSLAYNEAIKIGCIEIAQYLLETAANLETCLHMGLSDNLMRVNSDPQVQAFVKDTNKFNAGIRDNNINDINALFNVQLDSEDCIINIEPNVNITYQLIQNTFFDNTRPSNKKMDLLLEKVMKSYNQKHNESLAILYPLRLSSTIKDPSEEKYLPTSIINVVASNDLDNMKPSNSEVSSTKLDTKLLMNQDLTAKK